MEDLNKTAVAVLCIIIVLVLSVIVTNCTVCDIMANPPDWINSWYDGEPKEFFPTDQGSLCLHKSSLPEMGPRVKKNCRAVFSREVLIDSGW